MTDSAGEAARFLTRNAVDALPEGELERQLEKGRPLRVKLGVDPTTPDIHLGHTVVLRKLREFQDLGHQVVLIVGDYTARVGDPSGRSAMRPQVDPAEIDRNAQTYEEQAFKVLDRDATEVRRNGEWLDMPMEELFRLARTATVAQLLERDDFAKRYSSNEPISVLELLYPLLQGYDSVAIRADVELGGDRPEVQRAARARGPARLRGRAAVDPHDADPAGHRRRAEDVEVARQLRGRERPARGDVRQADAASRTRRCRPTTSCCWTSRSTLAAAPRRQAGDGAGAHRALPRRGGRRGGRGALRRRCTCGTSCPSEIEDFAFAANGDAVHLPALLADAFGVSRSEARRLLGQAGVKLDGEALDESALDLPAERLDGAVIQLGKRRHKRLRRR